MLKRGTFGREGASCTRFMREPREGIWEEASLWFWMKLLCGYDTILDGIGVKTCPPAANLFLI